MDDALAGTRVLIAGGSSDAAKTLGKELIAGAADVTVAPDAEAAAQEALAGPPDVIVAIGATERELREILDPLELRSGPPLISANALANHKRSPAERLRTLLDSVALERRVRDLESALATQTVARRRDLEAARIEMLRRLALAAEYRDDNTPEHMQRVAALAARLGQRLGLTDVALTHIRHAAPLHDVGKIAIPDRILLKPGRLSQAEFEVVKTHAEAGARVLAEGESELLEVAESIARAHHERWDGSGYPDGLSGGDIPLVGRLVHVADVFDVLVHERPYKDAFSVEDAAEEIRKGAGTQFDPEVVEAFADLGPRVWLAAPGVYGG
jgi:response regulator RpfG family c-di-GMP phosphodiesterase